MYLSSISGKLIIILLAPALQWNIQPDCSCVIVAVKSPEPASNVKIGYLNPSPWLAATISASDLWSNDTI